MKKALLIALIILLSSVCFAESITNLTSSSFVRLGEKANISGQFNHPDLNAYVLCKFQVKDSNNVFVDRWTDEYTFSDGSFYAEKTLTEPPYYRGDTYVIQTTCGTTSQDLNFTVLQPVSLAHPIQRNWEYFFDESNLDAIAIFVSLILLIAGVILIFAFLKKMGGHYAS